jgi:hypothetical protein
LSDFARRVRISFFKTQMGNGFGLRRRAGVHRADPAPLRGYWWVSRQWTNTSEPLRRIVSW